MTIPISALKKNILIKRNLRWDVTPEVLFKPRFSGVGGGTELGKETEGFMFYLDYVKGEARLMLMRTIQMMSSTQGQIEGVPQDVLLRAVTAEGVKPIAGMYPMSRELEEWLKKALGITSPGEAPRP